MVKPNVVPKTSAGAIRRYAALLRDYNRRYAGGGQFGHDWPTLKMNDEALYHELRALLALARVPTREQLKALLDFAAQNGRGWKVKLDEVWMKASGGPHLQQVRNNFGPSWLQRTTLKQIKAMYEGIQGQS